MLTFFRKYLTSPPVLGLFAIILIAFVVTGVDTNSLGLGGGTGGGVAKVGSFTVSEAEAERRAQVAVEAARQQDPALNMSGFVQAGGVENVVDQLINGRAVEAFAAANGMIASKRLVDGQIASIPAFNGPTGTFDRNTFLAVLGQRRINEADLRKDFAREALTRQLLIPVNAAARVPANLVLPYAALLVERREGQVAPVPATAFAGGAAPTEAELTAFYRANVRTYTVPERRVVRYALFDRAAVAGQAAPSEAEIAVDYKANAQLYGASQTRGLTQAIIADQAAANAVLARIKGGASFADALKPLGLTPLTLPPADRAGLARAAGEPVAAAAFAAQQGVASGPVRGSLGFVVFRVDQIVDKPAKTLAQARGEIVTRLTEKKSTALLAERIAKLQEAVDDGATFDEAVKDNGLTAVATPAVTASGLDPDNTANRLPPEMTPLLRDAFAAETDDDPQVATIAADRFAVWKLDRIVPAAPRPLNVIREGVTRDFLADRAAKAAKRVADTILAQVNRGTPLKNAVAASGARLPPVQVMGGRRLEIMRDQGKAPPPLALMFALTPGKARLLQAPNNGGWFVVTLDKIVPGNLAAEPGLVPATQQQLSRNVGDEYVQQFMNAVRAQVGVTRDAAKVAAVKRSLAGGAR